MNNLLKVFSLLLVFFPICVAANTLKLTDIFDEKGLDYIVVNHETISKKIDDKDKFDLAYILIMAYKGPEAIPLLSSLGKKGHVGAINLLVRKYSLGLNGIAIDEQKSRIWIDKLEASYKKANDYDKEFIEYQLCEIYGDNKSVLKNESKEKIYCLKAFERPKNIGLYAIKSLDPKSVFFEPSRGLELFNKCIQDGGWACKVNYAFIGLASPEIAKSSSAEQLFEYASDDKSVANAVNNLGLFYERGIGTKVDIEKAVEQFDKAINYGSGHGMYNLLFYSFFYPGEFKSTAKDADDAKRYLMIYDYWTEQNGRYDALPYKEWLSEKNRMPTSQSEFLDYLKDKAKNGDARSSCLLGDYYRNINQLDTALTFTNNGKKSADLRVRNWCDYVDRSVQVMRIYSSQN
jgi:hypothetical protein